ncbi:MAG: hypothetical protein DRG24_00860 [Epsilonproteobacteria bacterium]|nr:MAG: hypothetical protein DRG24_00860 [Campylobacterota bacterium]
MLKRRDFLVQSALLLSLPVIAASAKEYASQSVKIYTEPYQTIAYLYSDLFPSNPSFSLKEINAIGYLYGVMHDERIDLETKEFIINGAAWLNEEAVEKYKKSYIKLLGNERQKILKDISMTRWGDSWLYTMMSYLFEAILSDPIYGGNTDAAGWQWFDHEPGFPRPDRVMI